MANYLSNIFAPMDASMEVVLMIDGETYEVNHFKISLTRPADINGKPQSETNGGIIHLTLSEGVSDNIYLWMKKNNSPKAGSVVFRTTMKQTIMNLDFENGHCIGLRRKINANSGSESVMVISPEQITIHGATHNKKWTR